MNERLYVKNAVIESATLGIERGFVLTSHVGFKFSDCNQGFGGFALGGIGDAACAEHAGPNICAAWIAGVLHAAECDKWISLVGRSVRVQRDGDGWNASIVAVGHIIHDDRWFNPREVFDALLRKAGRK